jgi:hypothetical protein
MIAELVPSAVTARAVATRGGLPHGAVGCDFPSKQELHTVRRNMRPVKILSGSCASAGPLDVPGGCRATPAGVRFRLASREVWSAFHTVRRETTRLHSISHLSA